MAAGDYIPIRNNIAQDPRVLAMAIGLKVDVDTIVGKLHRVWTIASENSLDGTLRMMSPELFDSILRLEGFSREMMSVGWLAHDDTRGLYCPNFDHWQESTSLKRAKEREKKRRQRQGKSVPGTKRGQVGTKRGQTRDHVPNTDTDTDIESNTPCSPPVGDASGFEVFWKAYPATRRIDKAKCEAKWRARKLDLIAEKIVAHVRAMAKTEDWTKDGHKFAPQTTTYLNQSRWETPLVADDDDMPKPQPMTEDERREYAEIMRQKRSQGVLSG